MPPSVTVNVAALIVVGSIGSLKTALTIFVRHTPPLPSAGLTVVTVGAMASAPAPVMKLHAKLAPSAKPSVSVAAGVTVATHRVPVGSGATGVKVATRVAAS